MLALVLRLLRTQDSPNVSYIDDLCLKKQLAEKLRSNVQQVVQVLERFD